METEPKTAEVWFARALQYEQTGNVGLAAKCLDKAVETEAREKLASS